MADMRRSDGIISGVSATRRRPEIRYIARSLVRTITPCPPEPAVNGRSDNYRDTTIMPLADCCCCCCCCYCCSSCCCRCRPNRHLFVACRHRRLLTLATPGTTFLPMNYIHVFRSRFFRLLMSWRRFRVCPRKSLLACFLLLKWWIKMYTKKCKSQNN